MVGFVASLGDSQFDAYAYTMGILSVFAQVQSSEFTRGSQGIFIVARDGLEERFFNRSKLGKIASNPIQSLFSFKYRSHSD